ncbi:Fha domain-containing protein ddl [Thalictrum thalictroides]|uniref:Fha domain-containing protein ddl n=1 Tax=Thalictrum thalictroides TaxID=46969 RepID=A0A7J6VA50_THATH|nr:Fha domain-containing protein ddl [Thalictrum thalictroides]
MKAAEEAKKKKEQPSFELSGKLAAETNRVKGVTVIYSEPIEARIPNLKWRLYVFKDGEMTRAKTNLPFDAMVSAWMGLASL